MFLKRQNVYFSLIVLGFLTVSYYILSVHQNITAKVYQAGKIIIIITIITIIIIIIIIIKTITIIIIIIIIIIKIKIIIIIIIATTIINNKQ